MLLLLEEVACRSLRPYCWVLPLAVEVGSEVTFPSENVRMLALPVPTMIANTYTQEGESNETPTVQSREHGAGTSRMIWCILVCVGLSA